MPKRNIFVSLGIAAAMLACPAMADGKPGTPSFKGPSPLTPSGDAELLGNEQPPVTRVPVQRTPAVEPPAPQPMRLDLSGFDGGVGAGISGGLYGGGGSLIVVGSDRRFSGVIDAPAAQFTFRHNDRLRIPRPMPKPGCKGGC